MLNYTIETDLSIELYTSDRSEQGLKLLAFPGYPLRPPRTRIKFKKFAQGSITRGKTTHVDGIASGSPDERLNRIETEIAFPPAPIAEEVDLQEIVQLFVPSPHSALWFPTDQWPKNASNQQWRNLLSSEKNTESNARYWNEPTRLAVRIILDTKHETDWIYQQILPQLACSFPDELLDLPLIGGGGICIFDRVRRNYTSFVRGITTEILMQERDLVAFGASFGKLFGVLQPVMIGKTDLCRKVHEALGPSTTYYAIQRGNGEASAYGIVYVPKEVLENPESCRYVSEYLTPMRSREEM